MMGFYGFGGFGLIFMVLFWIVIVGLAMWLLGNLFPRTASTSPFQPTAQGSSPSESALDILNLCPNCGTALKTACPACHRAVQVAWRLCPYCGADLKAGVSTPEVVAHHH